MKIDSTWTSILRKIDVDLMAVCSQKDCVQKYNSGKVVCALQLKSNVSINLCFKLSFLKHVSFLAVGAFGCYSMLTTLPLNCLKHK